MTLRRVFDEPWCVEFTSKVSPQTELQLSKVYEAVATHPGDSVHSCQVGVCELNVCVVHML